MLIAALLIVAIVAVSASSQVRKERRDDEGHVLESRWKEYRDAEKADKPKTAEKVLTVIKSEASARHLPWDFYDAGSLYVRSVINRDWKRRDSVRTAFTDEVKAFAEPVVTYANFVANNEKKQAFEDAKASMKRLEQSHNDQFYKLPGLNGACYRDLVLGSIGNDLEYVLWDVVTRGYDGYKDEARGLLEKQLGDRYPEAALAEYSRIRDDSGYKAFAEKYAGRGVSFIALQELLDKRFLDLRAGGATQEQYVDIRRECTDLKSRMKALQGEEKRIASCCKLVDELLEVMDAESVSASIRDGVLKVEFQNLASASVSVTSKEGKTVFHKEVANPVRSYFVHDTATVQLPAFDDGNYVLKAESGKNKFECGYDKYTISLASRADADEFRIYAADYITGKPVAKATLKLVSSDRELARVDNFVFDGFTKVPDQITGAISKSKYSEIVCEYRDSKGILHKSFYGSAFRVSKSAAEAYPDVQSAVILCDRAAFKPGEKVQFKGVVFHGDHYKVLEPVEKGFYVKAALVNPDGNDIASIDLITNEFGSVAGSFDLPAGGKNGGFMIELRQGRMTLKGEYITVDDFVLPSYVIEFDETRYCFLAGDMLHVKGRVKSYSGHSLSAATAEASVTRWGDTLHVKTLDLASDGSFDISFQSNPDYSYSDYRFSVKVVDGTGETVQASKSLYVTDNLELSWSLENACEGDCVLEDKEDYITSMPLLCEDVASVRFDIGARKDLEIKYELLKDGRTLGSGTAGPDGVTDVVLPGESGRYELKVVATAKNASGKNVETCGTLSFLKVTDADTVLDAPVQSFFRKIEGKDIAFVMGAASGDVWAVVELFDEDMHLLLGDKVHLEGRRGEPGSLRTVRYAFNPSWGEIVTVKVLYFRNGRAHQTNMVFETGHSEKSLDLEFDRVVDVSLPGASCTVTAKTGPDVECVATVYDSSTEKIRPNVWNPVRLWASGKGNVWYSTECGRDRSSSPVRVRGMAKSAMAVTAAGRSSNMALNDGIQDSEVLVSDMGMVQEEAIPFQMVESKASFGAAGPVEVRTDFATTVAFEPFLRSDKNGQVTLSFDAGDKLSTFIVQMFAHDRHLNNSVIRRKMLVTLPVKMSVVEPQILYSGDKYVLKATVSSNSDAPVEGGVEVEAFDGTSWKDAAPILTRGLGITVPVGGSVPVECEIMVPDVDTLGLKLTFRSSDAATSDAIFVKVPVFKPVQTLTEAHSAVLAAGADREKLIADLRAQFVNVPGSGAVLTEISILDMVKDAIPDLVRTDRRDLVSAMNALYSGLLARSLKENVAVPVSELERKVLLCRCDCGGFAWFEGMEASPVLTALVLERYAALARKGLSDTVPALGAMVHDAVKYLDKSYFSDNSLPWWRGSVSLQQYLYVRSLYPGIKFAASDAKSKALKEFRKEAKAYLIPRNERGLNGRILLKSRRCLTLMHLSQDGAPLLSSWGISLGKLRRIDASCLADVESLLEYAVAHPCGGYYYPNAVMPWRGLMESELYAHAVLCELLDDASAFGADAAVSSQASKVAEGIRLWMMIQKETQQWGSDPAFVDALAAVLDGSEETLATRVLALKATFTKPFEEVAAAGNGFSVERRFSREGVELKDGDSLDVGDRIVATYSINNDENRSFVLLSCPRPASLRPVQQLSGRIGWWRGVQGYRNVLRDRTEYWYDSYPEEKTSVTEEFFVTQKGVFQTPAVSIESLYAPHYRANDAGRGPVVSK